MKLAMCAVLMIGMVGCREHAQAVYVREKSHHCAMTGVVAPIKTITTMGKVSLVSGWTIYRCDDDVVIVIDRGDEQP